MIVGQEPSSSGLYGAMTFHHTHLEMLARHVISTFHGEGRSAAQTSFSAFKRQLDAHLDAEETWLLPPFERANPSAYDAILAEHARLRASTDLAAAALDTEQIDEHPLHRLVEILCELCHREEEGLYRWAETAIDAHASRAVIQKIEGARLPET